jgi:hypothetical protein
MPLLPSKHALLVWFDMLNEGFDEFLLTIKEQLELHYQRIETMCDLCLRMLIVPLLVEANVRSNRLEMKRLWNLEFTITPLEEVDIADSFFSVYSLSYYYRQRVSDEPNRNGFDCSHHPFDPQDQYAFRELEGHNCLRCPHQF